MVGITRTGDWCPKGILIQNAGYTPSIIIEHPITHSIPGEPRGHACALEILTTLGISWNYLILKEEISLGT